MEQQTVRKTYKYKLKSTPEQERARTFVLRHCCELYDAALQERREAWQKCGVCVTVAQQSAQLPEVKEARPDYRDIPSQVLQDALARLDRAFQRFIVRVKSGEKPGYPRFHSAHRYDRLTYPQVGEHSGARLDNGFLILSKLGRIAVRWSRPVEGAIKTVTISREADGWYATFSCADVPVQTLPPTCQGMGIADTYPLALLSGR
jgi:putative transposase